MLMEKGPTRREFLKHAGIVLASAALNAAIPPPVFAESPKPIVKPNPLESSSPKAEDVEEYVKKIKAEIHQPRKLPKKSGLREEQEPGPSGIYEILGDKENKWQFSPSGVCSTREDHAGEMFVSAIKTSPYGTDLKMELAAIRFDPDNPQNRSLIGIKSPLKDAWFWNCFCLMGPDGKNYLVSNTEDTKYNGIIRTLVHVFEVGSTSAKKIITIEPPRFALPEHFELAKAESGYVNPDWSLTLATSLIALKAEGRPFIKNAIASYQGGVKTKELPISEELLERFVIVPGDREKSLGIYMTYGKAFLFNFNKDLSGRTKIIPLEFNYQNEPIHLEGIAAVFSPVTRTYDLVFQGSTDSQENHFLLFKEISADGDTGAIDDSYMFYGDVKNEHFSPAQICADPSTGETLMIASRFTDDPWENETVIINPRSGEVAPVSGNYTDFFYAFIHPHKGADGNIRAVAVAAGVRKDGTELLEINGYNRLFMV